MDCAVFMREPEIERATVCKTERQFKAQSMEAWNVERIRAADTALDLQVRRDRLTIVREMLIHGEMVVYASETAAFFKEIAITDGLLDKTLHRQRTDPKITSRSSPLFVSGACWPSAGYVGCLARRAVGLARAVLCNPPIAHGANVQPVGVGPPAYESRHAREDDYAGSKGEPDH
jgi:hypothetical protein